MAHICQYCLKEFQHRPSLHRHLRTNACKLHGKNDEVFVCAECNRSFDRKDTLRDHVNSIHIKTKYACEYCKKSFHRSSLNRHKKSCKAKVQSEYKHLKKTHIAIRV